IGYTERLREAPGAVSTSSNVATPGAGEPPPGEGTTSDMPAEPRLPDIIVPDALTDPAAVVAAAASPGGVTLDPIGAHRVYSVWDVEGKRWYVVTLDGDRQVVGYLAALWSQLRLRGLSRRRPTSLRETADRAALLSYAAQQAGVRT